MNRRKLMTAAAAIPAFASPMPAAASALQKQIKITSIETDLLKMPPREPNYDAIHKLETSGPQKFVNGEVPAPEAPGMSTEVPRPWILKYKVG